MLSRLRNMFRVADLRNKILFTILIIAGLPGRDAHPGAVRRLRAIKKLQDQSTNARRRRLPRPLLRRRDHERRRSSSSGSCRTSRRRSSCSCSAVVIPKLEQWQQEGQSGQKKITQWTRYLTVGLALIQSTGFVFALQGGQERAARLRRLPGQRHDPRLQRPRAALIVTHVDGRHRPRDVAR